MMMDADHLAIVGQGDKVSQNGSRTVRAADVHPISIDWLWTDYVPRGMTSIFGGFPGVGKSTILYDLAARTSCEGKVVLIVTAEDHLAAVVRPRLEAAGADLDLVRIVTVPITLPDDVAVLGSLVRDYEAALLVLDPLVAFIGDGVNTHRDHHVRRVLAPLADLAEKTGVALVVVIHTNKGRENEPLMRISGSIGFSGAARTVLLAADDPKEEARRIFAVVKSNLAEFPPPLAYRVVGVQLEGGISTSRIEWLGQAPEIDVRELLVSRDPDERSAREDAIEFLVEAGVQETAQPVADLMRAAAAMQIGEKTLQRARRALGIPAWLDEFGGAWKWGPKLADGLDTQSGHPTPVQTSKLELPAETPTHSPSLDTREGSGGPDLKPPCPDCGRRWFHGHAEDCPTRGRKP
jgi:putative DNA primase/helicase